MRLKHLLNLTTDCSDLLDFFERVDSHEQMISRLERLKKADAPESLLACVEGLRASLQDLLDDTVESAGPIDDGEENESEIDALLDQVKTSGEEDEKKDSSPPEGSEEKDSNQDVTPSQ